LHPYQHGLVDNDFPNADRSAWYHVWDRQAVENPDWYGGEPTWVSAEKNGMTSAAFYFVGTEAPVGGYSPTYWKKFDANIPGETRVNKVLEWLTLPEKKRPHIITLYFEHVDSASHDYGPDSFEAEMAVEQVDGYLVKLLDGIENLDIRDDVTIIVVSDHGQAAYQTQSDAFVIADHVDLEGLTVFDHGSFVNIYVEPRDVARAQKIRDALNANWEHGRAYLRAESPEHWRVPDDPKFADIVILADPTYRVVSDRSHTLRNYGGAHGWDPSFEGMHAIFLASGPRLPSAKTIGEINNVEVYPMMMEILGLPLPDNINPEGNRLLPLLTKP
jgi:predicted AlkP superfamily pyrophosphatase or phosphodiesterase